MEIDKELVELKRALETYTELKNIVSIEFSERCKNVILENKFRKKYGINIAELSATVIQLFYEIGKEDGLKEAINKLNKQK